MGHLYFLLGLAGLAFLFFASELYRHVARRWRLPFVADPVLFTARQRAFLPVLERAVGRDFQVYGRVRVADVIGVRRGLDRYFRRRAHERLAERTFDFLVCARGTGTIACAVNLAPRSRFGRRRPPRDALDRICAAAGMPFVRFRETDIYSVVEVEERVFAAMEAVRPDSVPDSVLDPRVPEEPIRAARVPGKGLGRSSPARAHSADLPGRGSAGEGAAELDPEAREALHGLARAMVGKGRSREDIETYDPQRPSVGGVAARIGGGAGILRRAAQGPAARRAVRPVDGVAAQSPGRSRDPVSAPTAPGRPAASHAVPPAPRWATPVAVSQVPGPKPSPQPARGPEGPDPRPRVDPVLGRHADLDDGPAFVIPDIAIDDDAGVRHRRA